ncbi:response regulator transcription factor [Saccharophagus degradans]|uniref:Response regulator receiver n=2 Tax=Saccharophagus degradans TaxID=86304 RepID=Q21HX3_SACD2|nr:response regulator transcription factor [Saccharophagus degradans]ABD81706.1 response regulator receiver [Saccharophagus degradans 2-40]MBU2986418.1 response regulator transcription factor [Saccharophagus degradans]MDO6424491.1 response regulator transcription factor [Saccharophagus degradans]MDO6608886.1 response regulator transcription factor [Saccharophagus degradans]WGP00083.1 response regulator transcription factor [Saccharophagus degradans]
MRILILEDNRDIAESVGEFFELNGHHIDYAMDGLTAMHLAVTNEYDIYLFDIGVPGTDGISLTKRLRIDGNDQTPIIFLTARETLEDKIKGFESGCDDYVVKPFQLKELLVRVNAIYKRSQPQISNVIDIAGLRIDKNKHEVTRDNVNITITPVCYKILLTLAESSPNVVSREKIESIIWKDIAPSSDSLKSHLYSLRQKVDKPFDFPLIHTVSKQGFRLYKAS